MSASTWVSACGDASAVITLQAVQGALRTFGAAACAGSGWRERLVHGLISLVAHGLCVCEFARGWG